MKEVYIVIGGPAGVYDTLEEAKNGAIFLADSYAISSYEIYRGVLVGKVEQTGYVYKDLEEPK